MNNKVVVALIVVLIGVSGFSLYKSMQVPVVKYVRSSDLIYGFDGMKLAHLKIQKIQAENQGRLDTLKQDFQLSVSNYNTAYTDLNKKEKAERENLLRLQQQNLEGYAKQIQENNTKEDNRLTEGVLNQVNAFVEQYAKDNGYDIILGTTTSGNILYGNKAMDITEEVLEAINEDYKVEGDNN